MSNFNDLYDHVAADRSRAMQLLGIQDIRRKAVAELLAAGAYTEPDNIEDMTDAEREQHPCRKCAVFCIIYIVFGTRIQFSETASSMIVPFLHAAALCLPPRFPTS